MSGKRRARGEGALFKRAADGLWVARIEIPTGDGNRRRVQVTSRDRNEVIDKRRELIRQIEAGVNVAAPKQTLERWLTHWLDVIAKPRLAPGTLTTYRSNLTTHVIPAIGKRRLDQLTTADIRTALDEAAKTTSPRTVQSVFAVLRKALEDALREGLIAHNPATRMDPPRAKSADRGHLDATGFRTLVQHLTQVDPGTASRIAMSLFTGARQAECLGLEWDRIDWNNKLIDLSWTLRRLQLRADFERKGAGDLYPREAFDVGKVDYEYRPVWRGMCLTQPKTAGSRRIVPMIAPLEAALREHLAASTGVGLVWTRADGAPVRDVDDTAVWKDTLRAAGVVNEDGESITLHAARHTLATLLLDAGVEESVRMQIVGHSSVTAQRIYAHVDQTQTRAALGELTKLLDTGN